MFGTFTSIQGHRGMRQAKLKDTKKYEQDSKLDQACDNGSQVKQAFLCIGDLHLPSAPRDGSCIKVLTKAAEFKSHSHRSPHAPLYEQISSGKIAAFPAALMTGQHLLQGCPVYTAISQRLC